MARCLNCGNKFDPYRTTQLVCSFECSIEYQKNWKKRKKALKIELGGNLKNDLQSTINKLARLIDTSFGFNCIDCGKPYGKQSDGAHFHSVGSNPSLRYNLHNIHKSRTYCNKYSDKHKQGYERGLEMRYGLKYYEYVKNELPLKYTYSGFSKPELSLALKNTRQVIRDIDKYTFPDAIEARDFYNYSIGLYDKD